MLPKTRLGERAHRERKRQLEIGLIIEEISSIIKNDPHFANRNIRILEFGSGDGFQIPQLSRLGQVVASDVYISDGIRGAEGIAFVECGIDSAPFVNGQFDLIFSNHVIEHIEDMQTTFQEIQRIGSPNCVFAFSVPTNIWLLLSVPAFYYGKLRNIINKPEDPRRDHGNTFLVKPSRMRSIFSRVIQSMLPTGHGIKSNFIECYHYFKIENWHKLLCDHGFSIIKTKPLLLYGPSEWPIIPILKPTERFSSSVLFLMKKGREQN